MFFLARFMHMHQLHMQVFKEAMKTGRFVNLWWCFLLIDWESLFYQYLCLDLRGRRPKIFCEWGINSHRFLKEAQLSEENKLLDVELAQFAHMSLNKSFLVFHWPLMKYKINLKPGQLQWAGQIPIYPRAKVYHLIKFRKHAWFGSSTPLYLAAWTNRTELGCIFVFCIHLPVGTYYSPEKFTILSENPTNKSKTRYSRDKAGFELFSSVFCP